MCILNGGTIFRKVNKCFVQFKIVMFSFTQLSVYYFSHLSSHILIYSFIRPDEGVLNHVSLVRSTTAECLEHQFIISVQSLILLTNYLYAVNHCSVACSFIISFIKIFHTIVRFEKYNSCRSIIKILIYLRVRISNNLMILCK